MILLSGHSLAQSRRVPVETMSLSLKERESTAQMVPADMTGITTESWFADDTNPGRGIVWRVKSIQTAYATETPTIQLEHVICILRDRILFGEITPEMIGGGSTCTAEQAVRYILDRQSDWTLGAFEYGGVRNAYKFDGNSLYDALVKVSDTLADCWWSYDMSRYPFVLNITRAPSGVACEMRPGRNLVTLTKTIDRTGMYTRHYPIGKDDLHIAGDYVSRNEHLYGVSCKVEVDQSLTTEAELRAWSNERLDKHAQPKVSIMAEGLELADATGESIDRLTLGRICRAPLTEFSTTIQERIVELSYRDKIHEPENVKITMANSQEDVTRLLAAEIRDGGGPGGGGARSAARTNKEDHAWFEDTNDHVAMVAEGIVGKDAAGNPNWIRLSQIIVDGEGIHQTVESIQNENVIRNAKIDMNEERILQEVNQRIAEDQTLQGKINVEAGKISMVVGTREGNNYIKAAQICLAINADGSSDAVIEAKKIHLLGQTIADTITADLIQSKVNLMATLRVKQLTVASRLQFEGGPIITGAQATDIIRNLQIVQNGSTYKLRKLICSGEWVDVGSFSRATALTGAWSSGIFTVTASPQGNQLSTSIQPANASWSDRTVTIPIYAAVGGSIALYDTGKSATATYTADKSDILASRGNRQSSDPAHDAVLTTVTQNGYYLVTVNACGAEKKYRIQVNVA